MTPQEIAEQKRIGGLFPPRTMEPEHCAVNYTLGTDTLGRVILFRETPHGTTQDFIDPNSAEQLGQQLVSKARFAKAGLIEPQAGQGLGG